MSEPIPAYKIAANAVADATNADVLLVNSPIARPLDLTVLRMCRQHQRRENVLLVLITEGGDPDPAYRLARCLQDNYRRFSLFVSGYCKSAGTLVALGAHELIVADRRHKSLESPIHLRQFYDFLFVFVMYWGRVIDSFSVCAFGAFGYRMACPPRSFHARPPVLLTADIQALLTPSTGIVPVAPGHQNLKVGCIGNRRRFDRRSLFTEKTEE
ncbi:MAG: hypothetical protein HY047_10790 [Acidobacteria bacterium]|nr:hypothetical protein [Acidobacteriota bacterium]